MAADLVAWAAAAENTIKIGYPLPLDLAGEATPLHFPSWVQRRHRRTHQCFDHREVEGRRQHRKTGKVILVRCGSELPTLTQKAVPRAGVVAFNQSRDDRSAERERVSVLRWLLAMKLSTLLLLTVAIVIFRWLFLVWKQSTRKERHTVSTVCSAHASVATSKDATTRSLVRRITANKMAVSH